MNYINFCAAEEPQIKYTPTTNRSEQPLVQGQNRPNIVLLPPDSFNKQQNAIPPKQHKSFNWDSFYRFAGLATSMILTFMIGLTLKPTIQAFFRKSPNKLFTSYTKDPTITKLSELPGMNEIKEIFQRKVINPAKYNELYANENIQPRVAILLTGTQGTGKTNFVYSAAKEVDALVATIKLSEEGSSYVNGTSLQIGEKVKAIMAYAKKHPDKEIFILFDEIEAILSKSNLTGEEKLKDIKTILQCLDNLKKHKNIRVFATTNEMVRPDGTVGSLDVNAVSRFLVTPVKKPDYDARRQAIQFYLKDIPSASKFLEDEEALNRFARATEDCSYRDLVQIKDNAVEIMMNAKIAAADTGLNPNEVLLSNEFVQRAIKEFRHCA